MFLYNLPPVNRFRLGNREHEEWHPEKGRFLGDFSPRIWPSLPGLCQNLFCREAFVNRFKRLIQMTSLKRGGIATNLLLIAFFKKDRA